MARKTAEDKLKSLDIEREKLIEQLADKKAKELLLQERVKARQSEQARKDDTRRKVLLGSFVLSRLKSEGERGTIRSWLEKDLSTFLTSDRDKALFSEILNYHGLII
jgi:hypothetical protein